MAQGRSFSKLTAVFPVIVGVGSKTFDPPSQTTVITTASDGIFQTTVTVTGAVLGDFCVCSFSLDLTGILMTADVTAADTVTVTFGNITGGTLNIASGTLRVVAFDLNSGTSAPH